MPCRSRSVQLYILAGVFVWDDKIIKMHPAAGFTQQITPSSWFCNRLFALDFWLANEGSGSADTCSFNSLWCACLPYAHLVNCYQVCTLHKFLCAFQHARRHTRAQDDESAMLFIIYNCLGRLREGACAFCWWAGMVTYGAIWGKESDR